MSILRQLPSSPHFLGPPFHFRNLTCVTLADAVHNLGYSNAICLTSFATVSLTTFRKSLYSRYFSFLILSFARWFEPQYVSRECSLSGSRICLTPPAPYLCCLLRHTSRGPLAYSRPINYARYKRHARSSTPRTLIQSRVEGCLMFSPLAVAF